MSLSESEKRQLVRNVEHGIEKAGEITKLQIMEADRLIRTSNLPNTPDNVLKLTQIIAINWSGLD